MLFNIQVYALFIYLFIYVFIYLFIYIFLIKHSTSLSPPASTSTCYLRAEMNPTHKSLSSA